MPGDRDQAVYRQKAKSIRHMYTRHGRLRYEMPHLIRGFNPFLVLLEVIKLHDLL
jgi:hypothetical protein